MDRRFAAIQQILHHDPDNWTMLVKVRNCGTPYPCYSKYCEKCSSTSLATDGWRVRRDHFVSTDVVNAVFYKDHVGKGAYRQVEKTIRMLEPFYGLPVGEIAPFTIKFAVLQGGEDFEAVKKFYASWMREISLGFRDLIHTDIKMVYRFEWSWTTAGQVKWDLPFRAPGSTDVRHMDPDQVVALLHVHGFAHFPGFRHHEAGQFFRMVFEGPWQVHVSEPRFDREVLTDLHTDRSWLTAHDALHFRNSDDAGDNNLSDHPNDIDEAWEFFQSQRQHCHEGRTVDEILDALSAEYDLQHERMGNPVVVDQNEIMSGLVGFARYCCKDHLPKAKSRLANRNVDPSNPEAVNNILTPEQMVIACHADAELKRAFYRKRMMYSFGVIKRTKPKPKVNAKVTDTDVSRKVGHYKRGPMGIATSFDLNVGKCETGSIDIDNSHLVLDVCRSLSEAIQNHDHTCQSSYYTKEAIPVIAEGPLFCCTFSVVPQKLCLGVRILRPP